MTALRNRQTRLEDSNNTIACILTGHGFDGFFFAAAQTKVNCRYDIEAQNKKHRLRNKIMILDWGK